MRFRWLNQMPPTLSDRSPARRVRFGLWCGLLLLAVVAGLTWAQSSRSSSRGRGPADDRAGVPDWGRDKELPRDVFTFVRLQYSSQGGRYGGWGGRRWSTDYPDAELNLCYRLQEMTSLKVDPNGKVMEITDPELCNYPFVYMVEPGSLQFSEEEVVSLRRYLLNGGFMMVDDFWGPDEWDNFYYEIKRVFPDREPQELPMSHPIFHCVFDLKLEKNNMQVPNVGLGTASQVHGRTWEDDRDREVHFKGIFDNRGRMMVMICHNTDNGDGWEREGENEYYFREFSEKKAYPLGINIIFYAMTH